MVTVLSHDVHAQSIVFVVDSADAMRMVVAKDELEAMLEHADVLQRSIPILIFANKSDKQGALAAVEIMSLLELQNIKKHAWHIQCVPLCCVGSCHPCGHAQPPSRYSQSKQCADWRGCGGRH